jgi:hypothetical protein
MTSVSMGCGKHVEGCEIVLKSVALRSYDFVYRFIGAGPSAETIFSSYTCRIPVNIARPF